MSTLEATASMLEPLTEEQLISIQQIIRRLTGELTVKNPFKPLKEEELLLALQEGEEDLAQGKKRSGEAVIRSLRAKYGL